MPSIKNAKKCSDRKSKWTCDAGKITASGADREDDANRYWICRANQGSQCPFIAGDSRVPHGQMVPFQGKKRFGKPIKICWWYAAGNACEIGQTKQLSSADIAGYNERSAPYYANLQYHICALRGEKTELQCNKKDVVRKGEVDVEGVAICMLEYLDRGVYHACKKVFERHGIPYSSVDQMYVNYWQWDSSSFGETLRGLCIARNLDDQCKPKSALASVYDYDTDTALIAHRENYVDVFGSQLLPLILLLGAMLMACIGCLVGATCGTVSFCKLAASPDRKRQAENHQP